MIERYIWKEKLIMDEISFGNERKKDENWKEWIAGGIERR